MALIGAQHILHVTRMSFEGVPDFENPEIIPTFIKLDDLMHKIEPIVYQRFPSS